MDKMKHIREDIEELIYEVLEANEKNSFKDIDTCELGEALDMLKDISEAIYYAAVVEAMEDGKTNITCTKEIIP